MIQRQTNFLGNMRVDSPHLRAMESSVAADFDLLAGIVMAGSNALVINGFDIVSPAAAIGGPATSLQLNVANGIIFHPTGTESGTMFRVVAGTAAETLSGTNAKIIGAFTASQVNYIGLDLRRTADSTTSDLVEFLDASSLLENPLTVPLARTLDYRIIISTIDFSSDPTVLPIAKVTVSATNTVTLIVDCRQMMFRLATGGSVPDKQHGFVWSQSRCETTNDTAGAVFSGGDKAIGNQKDFFDAVMTRLFELGGGEYWYSPTSDRDVKLCLGQPVIPANGKNFLWTLGAQTLQWAGLSITFANSTATYNTITAGTLSVLDGYCIYVDVNRLVNATVLTVPAAVPLASLGSPTVPGSRFVLAWRRGTEIFTRTEPYEAGRALAVATNAATTAGLGVVRLTVDRGAPINAYPTVIPLDIDGTCGYVNTVANKPAFWGQGDGTASGIVCNGGGNGGKGLEAYGATAVGVPGNGIYAVGGTCGVGVHAGGIGVSAVGGLGLGGGAAGEAILATAVGAGNAIVATSAAGAGYAISAIAGSGDAIHATGGTNTQQTIYAGAGGAGCSGIKAIGGANGVGAYGLGGAGNSIGVYGEGVGSGDAIYGLSLGTGLGVHGKGGTSNGTGVYGVGGANNGRGVSGLGLGTGCGVYGLGGSTGAGGAGGIFYGGPGAASTGIEAHAQGTGAAISIGTGEIICNPVKTRHLIITPNEMMLYSSGGGTPGLTATFASCGSWTSGIDFGFAVLFRARLPAGSTVTAVDVHMGTTNAAPIASATFQLNYQVGLAGATPYTDNVICDAATSTASVPTTAAWTSFSVTNVVPILDPATGAMVCGVFLMPAPTGTKVCYVDAIRITYSQAQISHNV